MLVKRLAGLALLLSFCTVAFGQGANFPVCLLNVMALQNTTVQQQNLTAQLQNLTVLAGNTSNPFGTVDMNGNITTDPNQIVGLTYHGCVKYCGSAPVEFNWSTFSQQFTSWLLPWLALISQLPYGTKDTLSNFLAVIMTVGSPTLAAYSLVLAVISNRWMVKRFGRTGVY
ncbi:hypothetical protein AX14_011398 [Amanita brunnescens Koide BX004]|nr:hypothetical protein AX14_011398 [Amanita brunnescens Koide BX004]